jgi:putative peptidoglycan lipid II flippase
MYFAAISVAINLGIALAIFPSMGGPGIAIASAVAGWVNAALLLGVLIKRGHWGGDLPLLTRIPRLIFASAVMAAAIWYVQNTVAAPYLAAGSPIAAKAIALAAIVSGAMLIYFAVAFGTGGASLGVIRRSIRRPKGGKPASPPLSDEF